MKLHLLRLCVLAIFLSAQAQPILPSDILPMLEFASSFQPLPPSGWNVSDPASICSWPGVACSTNVEAGYSAVGGIDLSGIGAGLVGEIPYSIGDLHLQYLVLSPARFPGPFPEGLTRLSLHTLICYNCGFTGPLPKSIPTIVSGILRLESNELSGPLPDYTGSYFLPAEIGLSNNRFAGTVPESWLTLAPSPNPVTLMYVQGNKLFGCFNNTLPYVEVETPCDFSSNYLCCVSSTCAATSNRCLNTELDLIGYIINGTYPTSQLAPIANLATLIEGDTYLNTQTFACGNAPGVHHLALTLTLQFNQSTDSFQQISANGVQWEVSAVQSGSTRTWTFEGDLPCPVSSSKVVLSIFKGNPVISIIVNNQISALYTVTSPTNTGNYAEWPTSAIQITYTSSNPEVDALLDFASSCTAPPTGWNVSFPNTVCQWQGIECRNNHVIQVYLYSQPWLNCTITDSLADLTNLLDLDLHEIGLRGTIPAILSNLKNLEILGLSGSAQLVGTIPDALSEMTNLARIEIFNTKISGTLPPSLGYMPNLVMIHLGSNELTGPLPESYSNLDLQVLYLADNKLAGWIPQLWQEMWPYLGIFNVERNKLYGCLQTPGFPPEDTCFVADNNFCCVPASCPTSSIEQQRCLGSPQSVMIWMSQYLYPPNVVFEAEPQNNIYPLGLIEGDTYLVTSTLNCNDPDVQTYGVNVHIGLEPFVNTYNDTVITNMLPFGDPSRWTYVADSFGRYIVEGRIYCNSYLDTSNFTLAQQSFALGVSVWQGSLVIGVLLQNDVAGAWASYATTSNGGIVTSNDVRWNGLFEVQFSRGPMV